MSFSGTAFLVPTGAVGEQQHANPWLGWVCVFVQKKKYNWKMLTSRAKSKSKALQCLQHTLPCFKAVDFCCFIFEPNDYE